MHDHAVVAELVGDLSLKGHLAAEYRLLTYRTGRPQAGILVGERVYPAHTLLAGSDAGFVLRSRPLAELERRT